MAEALAYALALLAALWAVLLAVNEGLEEAFSKLARAVGLATLVAFTSTTVALALIAGEALVFYHEPNPWIWALEVLLGAYGLVVGVRELLSLLYEGL